ncbi:hypothetical protein LOB94_03620 [Lactobacillus delbrueckii subsp. bulgaricus]|uniref:hypothetical protein n=1 Tax=Lactobacillus delbrueckii TaxID=1584 RepID=UPI0004A5CA00|nr:hypothetical protein [Lactobacillus delbrueckii]MCD5464876.1 hypothetical protein [Lactobacillus delbrueckii subsp. bulgaricus]MCD5482387.1 hypothetical protein [Lactobacillus delbrueckii subsp. bulgaricus]MCD5482439.1 hypothetical protein [Lactobacillus delbrueckii subsp. bulgaricus]MCT3468540.1 hypothetical protein [Lactobacillus delbrueckii subsp. bulgaricus]CDR75477.1 Protein of unknown function [Lactobacillus delbrueckii subsp. bulgaricus]
MIGTNYDLFGQIGNLWDEYSYALEDRSDWERSDAASLLIAWLVATDRCTMDDLKAGLKVFQKIGNCAISAHNRGIEFGPDDFVRAVMYEAKYEAKKEMGEEKNNEE